MGLIRDLYRAARISNTMGVSSPATRVGSDDGRRTSCSGARARTQRVLALPLEIASLRGLTE